MHWKNKRFTYVLRVITLVLFFITAFFALSSCEGDDIYERGEKAKTESEEVYPSVLIASGDCGVGKTVSEYIEAYLSNRGINVYRERESISLEGDLDGVIAVGKEGVLQVLEKEYDGPLVYCIWEDFKKASELEGAVGIRAGLSSKDLAATSMALLPKAYRFAIMSIEEGALDVQDACDEFDKRGVDYTVEALSMGQPYGDAIISAANKGYSAMILPYFELCAGGIDRESHSDETAIIAVGEGEPVKGALGTFCVDAQLLSMDTAKLFEKLLSGDGAESIEGGYYNLCISESVEKYFETDREGAGEFFPVIITE